jgi:quercetin dioxygenase-like cupin family protein
MTLDIAGYETAMEGEDMRAVVLTLDRGQTGPWHYHSTITDSFVCLKGPMVVETRAPRNIYVLNAGERCTVPPMTAHHVHGLGGGPWPVHGVAGHWRLRQRAGRWRASD